MNNILPPLASRAKTAESAQFRDYGERQVRVSAANGAADALSRAPTPIWLAAGATLVGRASSIPLVCLDAAGTGAMAITRVVDAKAPWLGDFFAKGCKDICDGAFAREQPTVEGWMVGHTRHFDLSSVGHNSTLVDCVFGVVKAVEDQVTAAEDAGGGG